MIISRERADITGPKEVCKLLKRLMAKRMDKIERDKEHFFVIILNTRNRVRCVDLVSTGTINSSLVAPREIFRRAIAQGACSIVLAHNLCKAQHKLCYVKLAVM
jgi:DNA repair protein RadC